MAATLAASAYFLTCCRPIHNSFCYLVEKPKLVNFYYYPAEYFLKNPKSGCRHNHDKLPDHCLNIYNICTDGRAWSLDDRQQRQHFQDIICGRIPHCGCGDYEIKPEKGIPKPTKAAVKPKKQKDKKPAKEIDEGQDDLEVTIGKAVICDEESIHVEDECATLQSEEGSLTEIVAKPSKDDESLLAEDECPPVKPLPSDDSLETDESEEKIPSIKSEKVPSVKISKETIPSRKSEKTPSVKISKETIPSQKSEKTPSLKISKETIPSRKSEKTPSLKISKETIPSRTSEKTPSLKISKETIPSRISEHTPSVKISKEISRAGSLESTPSVVSVEKSQEKIPSERSLRTPSLKSLAKSEKIPSDIFVKTPSVKSVETIPSVKKSEEKVPSIKKSEESVPSKESEKIQPTKGKPVPTEEEPKDVVGLTDELIEKLDRNLHNLESAFDKFVKKNRQFIQNLVECLDFEKQKQKKLEDDYNNLKQENEELRTQNDYLRMVNTKQLELFKNELDRGINENKTIYKRKMHLLERQLLNDQNELQVYKQTEKQYMEVVEQDNEKIEKMNNQIQNLKRKETQLLRNYMRLLKFLEDVKETLNNASMNKDIPSLRSVNTITDTGAEKDPNVRRVLKKALNDGVSALNVRDLSILHDAIQDLNDRLCHQTDTCGKNPTADTSVPNFTMNAQRYMMEDSQEHLPKHMQDYDTPSNLSLYPTRQKPDDRRVQFS